MTGAVGSEILEEVEVGTTEDGHTLVELQSRRGEPVYFDYQGFPTYLFEKEYELIAPVLDRIIALKITTTIGLSPLFRVEAVLKD